MTRSRVALILSAVAMAVSGVAVAAAQDGGARGLALPGVAADNVPLAGVQASPDDVVLDILRMWPPAPGDSTEQLEINLRLAGDEQLAGAREAKSFSEVNRILGGQTNALGSTTNDYVYTPVAPCRIVDTRNAGGAIAAGGSREFYVYGPGSDLTPQGGNAAGCPAPRGEPRAVHINLTAVPVTGLGNLRVYPANVTAPNASAVNFLAGTNIANALTVQSYYNFLGPREIEVYVGGSGTAHVVIDVLGYYYGADLTLGSGQTLTGIWGAHTTASAGGYYYAPISFSHRLASGPGSPNENFIPVGGPSTANCPGSNTNPTAAAGQLCAYVTSCSANVSLQCFGSGTGYCSTTASVHGAVLSLQYTAGTVNCWGAWAVTAP